MKKHVLRKLAATLLLAGTVTGLAASQAGATTVANSWWIRTHAYKANCTMHVALDEYHALNNTGQRWVDVKALGTVVCTDTYNNVVVATNRTTQPEVNLKIDGVVSSASTQTTPVWNNSYGMGRTFSSARWLWSTTNWQNGCHYYQGIFKTWINGNYDYVTTNTPKWICA